jgi:outer membrane receptor protein involved in Fe transport
MSLLPRAWLIRRAPYARLALFAVFAPFAGLALFVLATSASAQLGARPTSPPADLLAESSAPAVLTPPRLVQPVEPRLPADASVPPGAFVVLELLVDEHGAVTDVVPVEGNDAALQPAVAEAAKRFVFVPAQRDGRAIPARIRYRYDLPPPSATPNVPVPVPDPSPPLAPPIATPSEPPPPADDDEDPAFGATARTEAPVREVTRRPVTAERVAKIAGANNDPLRAVETLPGVARPPLGETLLLVRGAGANDSVVMVDGTPVLLLYHIGGLQSFLNPALLDRVDFYPGNFSARYGRAIGGAIDARLRGPKRDAWHGIADISLLSASLLVEGPIGDRASVAVAGRRSYIDVLLGEADDTFLAAPVYWDYQALASYRPGNADELYLQAFGSSDSLAILFEEDGDPELTELRGQLSAHTQFHRGLLGWKHRYGGGYAHDVKLGVGYLMLDAQIGELLDQRARTPDFHGRGDFHLPLAPEWLTLDVGFDFVGYAGHLSYEGPQFRENEVDPGSDLTAGVKLERDVDLFYPGGYLELTIRPWPQLSLIPGLRADYFSDIEASVLDPRFSARYELTDDTALKAGVGKFSKPPELGAAIEGIGNPELDPIYALHVSAGVEQALGEVLELDVEGFYKRLYDMVSNTEDGSPPFLVNEGQGRIYGLEVSLQLEADELFGSLAYTLSRSERQLREGEYLLFDYDQPHILTVAAGYELGKGWQLSGTFRLVSGNPETPIERAVFNADADRYLPIYGEPNSARAALFHRLDVRIEKRFVLGGPGSNDSVTFYLDVQNAYNERRPEATAYSFDYRRRTQVKGLPILPILGVRGEL